MPRLREVEPALKGTDREIAASPPSLAEGRSRPRRFLGGLVTVRSGEVASLTYAWLYILAVLMSYYIMRPIRDEMGVAGGVKNLPWLFTGTLVAMLALNVPFGALVRALPRVRFIAVTYCFFAANILLFALALFLAGKAEAVWVGRVFFIWISVFNLFVVSVCWAMMVDTFDSEQGKRLCGFIGATVETVNSGRHRQGSRGVATQ